GFFRQMSAHRFGAETVRLQLTVRDSFLPENSGTWLVQFIDGHARVAEEGQADAAVQLDISDFSSLVMGAVRFSKLHEYGLAELDDLRALPQLDRLFYTAKKPQSMTPF
ncbi:GNAT family N-acetyltransferase, partial [Mesorhizobium sp. M00.F.Ca.ET.186.01.1.1]